MDVTWGIVLVTPLLMTVTMITRPVNSLYTQLRIECTGLGPVCLAKYSHHVNEHSSCQSSDTKLGVESTGLGLFPVWRTARIMSMTMTMILVLSSSPTQNSEWRVQALAYSLFGELL